MEAVYADENAWLSQQIMAQLYDVEVPSINYHLETVCSVSDLDEEAVIQDFRITTDGKTYDTKHYNLSAIAVAGTGPRIGPRWPDCPGRRPRSRKEATP